MSNQLLENKSEKNIKVSLSDFVKGVNSNPSYKNYWDTHNMFGDELSSEMIQHERDIDEDLFRVRFSFFVLPVWLGVHFAGF